MSSLIITADDYGLSDDVNTAIVVALERGFATHASVMANMPSFEGACDLARERGLQDRLGVHLVMTEGEPLTGPIRSCLRFCDTHGRFRYWRGDDHVFRLSRAERDAVAFELRTQIVRCRERGIHVTHLDSHHHVHNKYAIGAVVIALAREFEVPRVRVAHNCGRRLRFANRTYKGMFNLRLRRAGLAHTRWFGSAEDYRGLRKVGRESFEVNIHPGLRDGRLIDLHCPERPLDQLLI